MPHTTMPCRRCTSTTHAPRRGLCTGCYWHVRTHDQLADYPPLRTTIDLDEVSWLRSHGNSTEQIATRLGVTPHGVRVAEHRALVRAEAGERR